LRVLSVGRIGFLLAMQSTTPHPTKAKTQAGGVGAPWNLYVTLTFQTFRSPRERHLSVREKRRTSVVRVVVGMAEVLKKLLCR
jgi:hypothetical protein